MTGAELTGTSVGDEVGLFDGLSDGFALGDKDVGAAVTGLGIGLKLGDVEGDSGDLQWFIAS